MCRDTCKHIYTYIYIYFNFKFGQSQPTILSFSNLACSTKTQPTIQKEKRRNSSHTLIKSPSKLIPDSSSTFLAFRISSPDVLVSLVRPPIDWASRLHVAADGMLKLDGHGARKYTTGMQGFSDTWSDGIWWVWGPRGGFFVGFLVRLGKISVFLVVCWGVCWCFSEMTDKWRWDVFLKTLKLCCMSFSIGGAVLNFPAALFKKKKRAFGGRVFNSK